LAKKELIMQKERIHGINKFNPKTLSIAHQDIVKNTRRWLEKMVVGLNLCPFSYSVIAQDQVYYAICDATTDAQLKQFYVDELQRLLGADENDVATSLLMFTQGLEVFDDYLDLLDWFQQLLEQAELTEHVQLASFHPQYQFEGAAADDLSHFTNRSPYPTIHLLRQAQMTKALAYVVDPEKIYTDNIKTLNKLGRQQVETLCPWGK
jgi:hypothetical protein